MTVKSICEEPEAKVEVSGEEFADIRRVEKKFTSIFDLNPAPMAVFDMRTGSFTDANKAYSVLTGYSIQELIGVSAQSFHLWGNPEDFEKMLCTLAAEGEVNGVDAEIRQKGGVILSVRYSARLIEVEKERCFLLFAHNMTEKKIMEEAHRKNEEKYRNILEDIDEGYFESDLNGNFTLVSDAKAHILGYAKEALIGVNYRTYCNQETAQKIRELYSRVYETGEPFKGVQAEFINREGKQLFAEFSGALIRDDEGRPTGFRSVSRDITRRKEEEETRRRDAERYQTLLEDIDECYFELDLKGRFTFVNDAQCRDLGYTRQELIGMNPFKYTHASSINKSQQIFNGIYKSGQPDRYEAEYIHKNGTIFTSEVRASLMRDAKGHPIGFRGLSRNITERIKAQEALRYSEERHRTILENMQESYFENDLEGRITFVNDMACRHLGYSKEELVGEKGSLIHDEANWEKMVQAYNKLHRTGAPFKLLETECIRKDGTKGSYEFSVDLIRDSKGVPTGFRGVCRDITERKRLTERLNRAEKMEALGTMAGGVAHDLNNVLGVLVGYSESLARRLPEKSLERQYAETIMQAGWRCTAIVDDLLTLARRGVNVSEVTDLNKLIFDYLCTPEFEQLTSFYPKVSIRTEIEEDLAKIKGSPVHLNKTIMNLVSNAMEAITGPGEVTIRTRNRYLENPLRGYDVMKEGDYVVLTISDTGAGISAKDLGKIFEPFYTKKVMGRSGTGLGLAVVWGAVKDHNGFIDVQSEEGKGTTFHLYFPVTREKMEKPQASVSPEHYMSQGESILVVDDVKEQRELAINMLGQLGYHVEAVSGGEEAIEYLKNRKADLVVLDMIMDPGIDGLETYRRIIELHPGQKAVIVSGFSENDQVAKAREMGAGAFVRKPYILEHIGLAVRRELDQGRKDR